MKTRAWLLFAGGAIVAAALAFWLPSGQKGFAGMGAGLLLMISGVTALNASPAGIAFVERRAGAIKAAGWTLVVLGVAVVVVTPFTIYPAERFGWIIYLGCSLSLIGFMTVRLPRLLRDTQTTRTEIDRQVELRAAPRPLGEAGIGADAFRGVSEGVKAALSVVRDRGAVLQIAGPWMALMVAFIVVALFAVENGPWFWKTPAVLVLAAPLFLLALIAIPTVVVAWARWSVRGEKPRYWIALPNRAALSVAWRLWLASSIIGTADNFVSSQAAALAARLGGSPDVAGILAGILAGTCVDLVLVAMATGWGLRLIALGLGDETFSQSAALIRTRPMWPGLPLGMIVALLPFTIVGVAIDMVQWGLNFGPADPVTSVFLLGSVVIGFCALIAATTYAGRVYLAVKDPVPGIVS